MHDACHSMDSWTLSVMSVECVEGLACACLCIARVRRVWCVVCGLHIVAAHAHARQTGRSGGAGSRETSKAEPCSRTLGAGQAGHSRACRRGRGGSVHTFRAHVRKDGAHHQVAKALKLAFADAFVIAGRLDCATHVRLRN